MANAVTNPSKHTDATPRTGAQLEAADGAPAEPATEAPSQDGLPMNLHLGRAAWLLTVATLLVGGTLLLLRGDYGYAAVAGVVALAAAINVF